VENDYLDNLLDELQNIEVELAAKQATIDSIQCRLDFVPDQSRDDIIKACDKSAHTRKEMAPLHGRLKRLRQELKVYEEA